MQIASIEKVRARIAHLILGKADDQHHCIGNIELRPHQSSAVQRIRKALSEFGGAVLCDPVGTGKTFIALAVPSPRARLTIVAPAVLRDMWSRALTLADRSAEIVSFESLSRRSLPECSSDFVIVDEAHHARNPKTVRYGMLARLVSRSDVLLLTATPIHNRRADLVALISLFLGQRASCLTPSELTRCVIRRDHLRNSIDGVPTADAPIWIRLREDHRIPELLLSLPPPLPPRDGGDGGVLITRSLIRQWASSDAALMGGLKRRIVRAESLIAALSDNTWPTKRELLSWISGDDSVQLGLPGILAAESSNTNELLDVVREHLRGLRAVAEALRGSSADRERASTIRQIRKAHDDRSIVAFSEYADTVNGLFGHLVNDGKVCALTASEAGVAGGPLSRAEAIRQFAPIANGYRRPPAQNAITLLLSTDLLSEGVNLQDAGVVIHLDIPWTPARMEQRLGRVDRVGSRHESIPSYVLRPPLSGDAIVNIQRILREKLAAAHIVVPVECLLPDTYEETQGPTEQQRNEEIRALLSEWLDVAAESKSESPVAAGVSSDREGFVAVIEIDGATRVVVSSDNLVSENSESILDVLQHCRGMETALNARNVRACERAALSWITADLSLPPSHATKHAGTSIRALVTKRINRILHDARTHQRARLAAKIDRALTAMDGNLGAYDELRLLEMCEQVSAGENLIDQIIELTVEKDHRVQRFPKILALIVLLRK